MFSMSWEPATRDSSTIPDARELELNEYPDCNCVVRDPSDYLWHDSGFRPPDFGDLIIYQFHIGVFYAKDAAGRADPGQGGDGTCADGAGCPDYFHGPGIPRGQILDRLAERTGVVDLVGGSGRQRQTHVRSASLHARPHVAPTTASGSA